MDSQQTDDKDNKTKQNKNVCMPCDTYSVSYIRVANGGMYIAVSIIWNKAYKVYWTVVK